MRSTSDIVVYSDASGREGHLGAAVVALDNNLEIIESQAGPGGTDGPMVGSRSGAHWHFLRCQYGVQDCHQRSRQPRMETNNSNNPLRQQVSLAGNPKPRKQIRTTHHPCDPPGCRRGSSRGNRAPPSMDARTLRQSRKRRCRSVGQRRRIARAKPTPSALCSSRKSALIRGNILAQWEQEWKSSTKGGHLRKIDSTLPATYTRKLYGNLPRNRAYLLTQLRTGHNWLSTYAKDIRLPRRRSVRVRRARNSHPCASGLPKFEGNSKGAKEEVGDAFNSVSSLLGGSNEGKKGKPDTVSRAKTVKAVLDFAEASQRFRSRAP